ncbi:MAG TPA: SH3 domain-containing C40 family peptidase [Bacilli bacterium]
MHKKFIIIVLALTLMLSVPYMAHGASMGEITSGVNFRSAPSVDSRIYRLLSKGTDVTVLSEVNSYWVKIRAGSQTGYVSTNYVDYKSTSTKADSILSYGKRFLGTPYLFGARPYAVSHKFDCSSFTQYVFAHYGISLPRVSRDQAKRGHYVSKSNLRKGDLVFFYVGNNSSRIGHVGIYAGNGQMLHTYGDGGVKFTPINRDYWEDRYMTARRVIN